MIPYLNLKAITAMHAEEYQSAAMRVLNSGWYLQGEENQRFENQFAQYVGVQHCVAVANGLDALRLMLMGYKELGRLADGDEVLVPAHTYIATVLAISQAGLKPVLVDPTYPDLNLDEQSLQRALGPKTRALLTVHLYGRVLCNESMQKWCKEHGLLLLEDAAQAHGCQMNAVRKVGALGDAAAFSFYPGKNLGAMGDAGGLCTNDAALATVVRSLANYGSSRKYYFEYQGINSRMSEMDAALLQVKLKYLDTDNDTRRRWADSYHQGIDNEHIEFPTRLPDIQNVYHIFPVFCDHRDKLQQWLESHGIQTMIHYPLPLHKQQCYPELRDLKMPNAEHIADTELSLPLHQALSADDMNYIIQTINAFHL